MHLFFHFYSFLNIHDFINFSCMAVTRLKYLNVTHMNTNNNIIFNAKLLLLISCIAIRPDSQNLYIFLCHPNTTKTTLNKGASKSPSNSNKFPLAVGNLLTRSLYSSLNCFKLSAIKLPPTPLISITPIPHYLPATHSHLSLWTIKGILKTAGIMRHEFISVQIILGWERVQSRCDGRHCPGGYAGGQSVNYTWKPSLGVLIIVRGYSLLGLEFIGLPKRWGEDDCVEIWEWMKVGRNGKWFNL